MRWAETYIVQPDGPDAGEPWRFTREQQRFLLWLYAIDDEGRWLYSTAALRRAKGWGKTPLLAALAIIEFIGPARFSHFDKNGMPVGKRVPLPLIQIAATSIDQTQNTRDMVRGMLAESPAEEHYGIEIGKGLIQFRDGRPGRIEPVTASSRGLEGARPTFVIADEVHHWVESNQGIHVWEVLDRNVRKTSGAGSRLVETTNAYNPAEQSIAQRTHEAALAGTASLLYDCVEAVGYVDLKDPDAVMAALTEAYGDSHWVDLHGLLVAIQDPRTSEAVAARFYLNQIRETADTWIERAVWDGLAEEDDPLLPREQIALGFDGSVRNDATALVASRLRDGKLFLLGLWEDDSRPGWEVDAIAVDARVHEAFKRFRVEWMWFADPYYWQTTVNAWALEYGDKIVFEFATNRDRPMAEPRDRRGLTGTTPSAAATAWTRTSSPRCYPGLPLASAAGASRLRLAMQRSDRAPRRPDLDT
ncbi:terminase large subunit [Nonomuraea sp. NBC_00507]|uniref:hypothetical protein n=1 Tax=Nonomuraea sp. NBC_00507 TaxID=2976002 RepID=UPI002E16CE47